MDEEQYIIDQIGDMAELAIITEFDAYQSFTDETAIYPDSKGMEYTALGLAGEAGEYAGKVSKYIRDGHLDRDDLAKELGDILWFVARAAEENGYYLSDIVEMNVNKLRRRKVMNTLTGSGDER